MIKRNLTIKLPLWGIIYYLKYKIYDVNDLV